MSQSPSGLDRRSAVSIALASSSIARQAQYVVSQGVPLFVWVHTNSQATDRHHVVVLCAPIGFEQVHAHRTLRHLADRLAAAGFTAVRFDYAGTGDSADVPLAYGTWLANTQDVLDWARVQPGCDRVSLFGLRLGAALASQVASAQAVDGLILWEPIVRGRTYARELKAVSMMAAAANSATDAIEAAGFSFPRPLLDEIGQIDLSKLAPKCARALILARVDAPADDKLVQYFSSLGIQVEPGPLPGYAEIIAEPHFTKVPQEALARTIDWLLASTASDDTPPIVCDLANTPVTAAPAVPPEFPAFSVAVQAGVKERFVTIDGRLIGILTEPAGASTRPLVLLPNAGSAYRIGPGRLHVIVARYLATLGFRCLRIDVSGLGDSVIADVQRENDCYTASAFGDLNATLSYVRTQLGASRVIVLGLCSGAYFAFQSAAQLPDPILIEAILINPLTYYWREGMTLETSPTTQHARFEYYKNAARQPGKWLKLLTGGTKIGIFGGIRILMRRLFRRPNHAASAASTATTFGHPESDDPARDLERIRQSGRQLACFFARSDPGYSLLMSTASAKVKELCDAGRMSIHFIDDADHTFSRQAARQTFLTALSAYLSQRYR